MSGTEFVVFDNGTETDWIDPAVTVNETAAAWFVDNGYDVYEVPKLPGRTVITRQKEVAR